MSAEESIRDRLVAQFDFLKDKIRIQRVRRIFAEVEVDKFLEVFAFAVEELKFPVLCAITGLDGGATLEAIYHIGQEGGITLNLKTAVPKEKPDLPSVMTYFPAAEDYERELKDLLGFNVVGLPAGRRYPLPDDWPQGQYPLRKDWTPDLLDPKENAPNA